MKHTMLVLALVLAAGAARAEVTAYNPIVKEIYFTAYQMGDGGKLFTRLETDYCLYLHFKAAHIRKIDAAVKETTALLLLTHPAPEVAAGLSVRAMKNWYVSRTDTVRGISNRVPLLSDAAWKTVPALLQNILVGLGVDDDDLVLIVCDLFKGNISAYYHPRYDRNKTFYTERLKGLQAYVKTNDMEKAVPLDRIVQEDSQR